MSLVIGTQIFFIPVGVSRYLLPVSKFKNLSFKTVYKQKLVRLNLTELQMLCERNGAVNLHQKIFWP